MYVPLDAATAARAAIVLAASRPWRLVELGLVDLPDACVAPQEGERHWAADRQQFGRSDLRHPRCAAAPAAETGRRDSAAAMQRRVHLQVEPPRCVAARAVDVQFKAVAGDVADALEGQRAKHGADV